jgi:signal transduction histidine kinase
MPTESSDSAAGRVNRAVLATSERCQREIAQAVHDTLCQTLGGAALMVKVWSSKLKAGHPLQPAQLDELESCLDRALDEARQLFNRLQPVTPGEDGLMSALSRLADETAKETPCEFVCENAIFIKDPETALSLYRVAQEAVKNALQHAQADHIKIVLADPDGVIALKVIDDGRGFTPQAPGADVGGREVMQCRAKTAGGTLTSESELRRGTTVTYILPKGAAHGPNSPLR